MCVPSQVIIKLQQTFEFREGESRVCTTRLGIGNWALSHIAVKHTSTSEYRNSNFYVTEVTEGSEINTQVLNDVRLPHRIRYILRKSVRGGQILAHLWVRNSVKQINMGLGNSFPSATG